MILQTQVEDPSPFLFHKDLYYQMSEFGWFQGQKIELLEGVVWNQYPGGDQEPQSRRWSKFEYYQMEEKGWFHGVKVELIDGEIMAQSPQKFPHYSSMDRVAEVLRNQLGPGYWVRTQAPLDLGAPMEPEPDGSVVRGSRADYTTHPTTALLAVEVSETTLRYDRGRKASLYAHSGIQDYWIINLVDRQLEVYRDPVPDNTQDFGFGYGNTMVLSVTGQVTPLASPQTRIAVADLLS